MGFTYEDVTPSLIPNTTMQKGFYNGDHLVYTITPNEGYVLHSKTGDFYDIDPETNEPTILKLGFSTNSASCGANYDFTPRTVTDGNGNTYTGYGEKEFFAVLASEVPENQIFGVENTPETM